MVSVIASVGAAGTAAVIAVTGIHPIDVVKTRLQVSGKHGAKDYKSLGIGGTIRVVAAEEGVSAFWKGIQAAWLREASYTSLRIGLYGPIKEAMGVTNESHFLMKFTAGSLAGALGSVVGNPFDVLKTRMMAQEGEVAHTFKETATSIYKGQGVGGFYRGMEANVMRAMVLNGTKMGVYDHIKGMITSSKVVPEGIATNFTAAFCAGFFMSVTVSPFDYIRTQLMNQPPDQKIYKNFFDCAIKTMQKGGPMAFYHGFIPIWGRFAPTTCSQLVIFEAVKPIFNKTF